MIEIKLTDSTGQVTLPALEVPLTLSPYHKLTEVETASANVYVDYVATKRIWTATWSYLTEDDFNVLKGFIDRQLQNNLFPEITIDHFSVSNVVVYMTLTPQNVIDHCGEVQDVTASFRETIQMSNYLEES